jgi:hypothetical protein
VTTTIRPPPLEGHSPTLAQAGLLICARDPRYSSAIADTEWLTLADAYDLLGEVDPKTLGRAMAQGDLAYRARRYGVRWLFIETNVQIRRSDLNAWKVAHGSASLKGHS